jgi:YD repeat-containing protein
MNFSIDFKTVLFTCVVLYTISASAAAGQEVFTYDSLGRLKSVSYPGGTSITYQYDAAGNRTVVSSAGITSVSENLTMTSGVYNCGPNNCPYALGGYVRTSGLPSLGSLGSTTIASNKTLANFYDRHSGGYGFSFVYAEVSVSGFGADPGVAWLVSASANGQTRTGASATYSYSSGLATWRWSTAFGFLNAGTASRTVTIVHN